MEVFIPGARRLREGLESCRLRVNLRYSPTDAHVIVRGELRDPHTAELARVMEILACLPAPVEVDLREVEVADAAGVDLLEQEQARRRRDRAAPLLVWPPLADLRARFFPRPA